MKKKESEIINLIYEKLGNWLFENNNNLTINEIHYLDLIRSVLSYVKYNTLNDKKLKILSKELKNFNLEN